MKKLLKAAAALALCVSVFALTGCDKDAPTLKIDNAAAIRDKFTVDFTIFDEDIILTELTATISGEVAGEDYTSTQSINFSAGEYAEDEEDVDKGYDLEEFMGYTDTVSFDGLDSDEKYTIIFTGTYNDKAKKMETVTETTTGKGGSVEEAHEISSVDDFSLIRNDPDGYFELKNDIDCSGSGNDKTVEVDPFFTSSKPFTGYFNGGGYKISNFHQESYDQYKGLFGVVDSGEIKNLTISDVSIYAKKFSSVYVGAVAGMSSGTISDVTVSNVSIKLDGLDDGEQVIGGFVGYNKGGLIENSTISNVDFDLNTPASARIGGFVGSNEKYESIEFGIDNCDVTDVVLDIQIPINEDSKYENDLEAVLYIGGFVGENSSKISDSNILGTSTIFIYSFEKITVASYGNDETIDYRSVVIEEVTLYVGGFAGNNSYLIDVCDSYLSEITVEASLIDKVYIGAFLGSNSSYANSMVNASFDAITLNVYYSDGTTNENFKTVVAPVGSCGIYLSNVAPTFATSGTITTNEKKFAVSQDKLVTM